MAERNTKSKHLQRNCIVAVTKKIKFLNECAVDDQFKQQDHFKQPFSFPSWKLVVVREGTESFV